MTTNYEFANIGKLEALKNKQYTLPDSKKILDGKIFLNDLMNIGVR